MDRTRREREVWAERGWKNIWRQHGPRNIDRDPLIISSYLCTRRENKDYNNNVFRKIYHTLWDLYHIIILLYYMHAAQVHWPSLANGDVSTIHP